MVVPRENPGFRRERLENFKIFTRSIFTACKIKHRYYSDEVSG